MSTHLMMMTLACVPGHIVCWVEWKCGGGVLCLVCVAAVAMCCVQNQNRTLQHYAPHRACTNSPSTLFTHAHGSTTTHDATYVQRLQAFDVHPPTTFVSPRRNASITDGAPRATSSPPANTSAHRHHSNHSHACSESRESLERLHETTYSDHRAHPTCGRVFLAACAT